jgi:hypothetical protein
VYNLKEIDENAVRGGGLDSVGLRFTSVEDFLGN